MKCISVHLWRCTQVGRRGAPAKGVGRETGAVVRIHSSPPKQKRTPSVSFFCFGRCSVVSSLSLQLCCKCGAQARQSHLGARSQGTRRCSFCNAKSLHSSSPALFFYRSCTCLFCLRAVVLFLASLCNSVANVVRSFARKALSVR